MFGEKYNLFIGQAVYIDNVPKETWRIINSTHSLVDTLLMADKELKQYFPGDKVYLNAETGVPKKNKFNNPIHSDEYARQYNQNLKGMVEKQMRLAITATANFLVHGMGKCRKTRPY